MKKVPRPSGLLNTPEYQQDKLRIQACYMYITTNTQSTSCSKLEQLNIQHSCFELIAINAPGRRKKLGEKVNKKILYQESDLLDVVFGGANSKETRYSTVTVGFATIKSPTFAKNEAHLQNVGLSNPTVTVLYLVSLLFAPPILHPTNQYLD